MSERREALLRAVWSSQDTAYDLMCEYDSLPHHYGENVLYQAEGHMIDLIALYPDITITDIANILHKTPSACSQMVRKLKSKGWVNQIRNEENNRQVNLRLTDKGQAVYQAHQSFTENCRELTYQKLEGFTEEELAVFVAIQTKLNEAYQGDVQRSRQRFQ